MCQQQPCQASIRRRTLLTGNSFEALINEIVEQPDERDKKKLAAVFAVQARTLRLTTTDLHYLRNKRNDPSIRNYTSFVKWSFGLCKKKTGSNPGLVQTGNQRK